MNRSILSINDLHIGVERVAGTTPQTMARLRNELGASIEGLVMAHLDKHLLINGDAFDSFNVEISEIFRLLEILSKWLEGSYVDALGGDQTVVAISRGNHDISKDSSRMSAFDFLCAVLKARYGGRVIVVVEPGCAVFPGHYVIPHMPNQALFDEAIETAIKYAQSPCYLHLHANWDNDFAVEADHSLNLSYAQAKRLVDAGYHLVFGHVHQQAEPMRNVTVVGNQFPTSIADCMGNNTKRAFVFHPDMSREEITTWEAEGSFVQIDWKLLDETPAWADFVRVTGLAKQSEAAAMLQAVSKFRQVAPCYVVSSAVKIEGLDDVAELEVAATEMKKLDVLAYLYEQLDPEQAAAVKDLLATHEVAA